LTAVRAGHRTDHAATARSAWQRRAEDCSDRPFLSWAGQTWTYAQADEQMRRIAAGLAERGVTMGTRVLVGMDNCPEVIFVQLALHELGAVLVALVPGLGVEEIAFQVEHSDATVLVAGGRIAEDLSPLLRRFTTLRHVILHEPREIDAAAAISSIDDLRANPPLQRRELDGYNDLSPAVIFYTSGSTARPKGIVLPAGSIISCGAGYSGRFGVRRDDTFLLPFTVAHGVGGLVVPGLYLQTGCHLALEPKFSPSVFWERVAETGATISLLFPAQIQLLLKLRSEQPPARSLRLVITHSWNEDFHDHFGTDLGVVWGSTELGALGAGSLGREARDGGEGYVGRGLSDEELGIADPSGDWAPVGSIGEIRVRHRHVMLQYLKDPDATARVLVDGWVSTGDFGVVDADGRLSYRGRLKSMVKRSGENISPEEIEWLLAGHPALSGSVVFGVPDPLRTEELAVVVVADDTITDGHEVSAFVAERLARWKAPRYVSVVREPFPRLPSGKIDRRAVAASLSTDTCWDRERETPDRG
jgi:acyl-CoA synthetase (AMP-forming)/AMP-acid ligase II